MTTFLLALAILAPGPKADAKPLPAGTNPLIGEWVVDSHVSSGKPIGRVGKPERITITEDRWKIGLEGMTESCLTVDSKKGHIDVWVPSQGNEDVPNASGIYKLEGDKLTMCYRIDGKRPENFESGPKSGNWLITLKRVKKD